MLITGEGAMLKRMFRCLFLVFVVIHMVSSQQTLKKWQTLSGEAPAVIARGGFSGLFPDSSQFAYQLAITTGLSNIILLCDLQLTKDGTGICRSDIRLENSTTISLVYPRADKIYTVNGHRVRAWFPIDYTSDQLFQNITLIQSIFSRPSLFDNSLPMTMVEDVTGLKPPRFWLSVQYDMFYKEHNLDVTSYVLKASKLMGINYISSPEIGFLRNLNGQLIKGREKLVFQFLEGDAIEPSTKQKYSSILSNLTFIKTFATGILVPKNYIWPVNSNRYLEPHTNLVQDAHNMGLEVFAFGFANDNPGSYNYNYDPAAEYLQFIDNSNFSVDGVLTDFPSTASASIACLAHNQNNSTTTKVKPLIITSNGASGIYTGCTDISYQKAVEDGADIIDCSVQMSKDEIPFCLNSADLMSASTALITFMTRSRMIPEIQKKIGIFSFDVTWSEIQKLKPDLKSPIAESGLVRNPANKNLGKFMTLSEFLAFAKEKNVPGILINIENAAYLASKLGFSITDKVLEALSNASYDKQSTQKVLIQSDDTSVLSKFKQIPSYQRVLMIKETISGANDVAVKEVKDYADAVNLPKVSVVSSTSGFLTSFTGVVKKMKNANISVYVSVLRNEYVTIPFDCFSDPMVELATFIIGTKIDGVVTEYPGTASAYLRSPCFNPEITMPYNILPAKPGSLLSLAPPEILPPAESPAPLLTVEDVVDPPLPQITSMKEDLTEAPPSQAPSHSGQSQNTTSFALSILMLVFILVSLSYH